jgi:hypothetical protein
MPIAPTLKRGYTLTGRRQYTLPLWLWLGLTRSLLHASSRPVAVDAECVIGTWREQPVVEGTEHIPRTGPMAVVANHYQRRGMWIGFGGGLLAREIRRARPDRASVHFAVIAALRTHGHTVPGTGFLFRRIARVWDMVSLPTDPGAVAGRAAAIRWLLSLALPEPRGRGEPILLFPEGSEGTTAGLRRALPGTGTLILLLARAGVPIVPAGLWESGGLLHARFGEPWLPEIPDGGAADRDEWARGQVMRRIAMLLPYRLRGVYAEVRCEKQQQVGQIGSRQPGVAGCHDPRPMASRDKE